MAEKSGWVPYGSASRPWLSSCATTGESFVASTSRSCARTNKISGTGERPWPPWGLGIASMHALFGRKRALPFLCSLTKSGKRTTPWNSTAQTCFTCCEAIMPRLVPAPKPPDTHKVNSDAILSSWAAVLSSGLAMSTGSHTAVRLSAIMPRLRPCSLYCPDDAWRPLWKSLVLSKMPARTVDSLALIQREHFASSFRSIVGRPSWTASGFLRAKPAPRHALHRSRFRG